MFMVGDSTIRRIFEEISTWRFDGRIRNRETKFIKICMMSSLDSIRLPGIPPQDDLGGVGVTHEVAIEGFVGKLGADGRIYNIETATPYSKVSPGRFCIMDEKVGGRFAKAIVATTKLPNCVLKSKAPKCGVEAAEHKFGSYHIGNRSK